MKITWKTIAPLGIWLAIWLVPVPAGLNASQWHYFALFAAVRPWMWKRVARLARNSARASNALCRWLETHELEPRGREMRSSEKVHVR